MILLHDGAHHIRHGIFVGLDALRFGDAIDRHGAQDILARFGNRVLAQGSLGRADEPAVHFDGQILARQLGGEGLHRLIYGALQLIIGDLVIQRCADLIHQLIAHFLVRLTIHIRLHGIAHALPELFKGFAAAHLARKGIVRGVFFLQMNFVHGAVKDGGLARQILGVVFGGEGDAHIALFADGAADQLFFKAGNEHAAAQRERLPLRRAALEKFAVAFARVIQNDFIIRLRGAIGDLHGLFALRKQAVDLFVHLRIRHGKMFARGAQSFIIQHFLTLLIEYGKIIKAYYSG